MIWTVLCSIHDGRVFPCTVSIYSPQTSSLVQLWTGTPKLHAVSDYYAPLSLLLSDKEKTIKLLTVPVICLHFYSILDILPERSVYVFQDPAQSLIYC